MNFVIISQNLSFLSSLAGEKTNLKLGFRNDLLDVQLVLQFQLSILFGWGDSNLIFFHKYFVYPGNSKVT